MRDNFFKYILLDGSSQTYSELEPDTFPFIFKADGKRLKNYRIYGAEGGVGDEITDENDDNYGKYVIPVVIEGKNIMQATGNPSTIRGVKWEYRSDGAVTGTRISANENVSDFTYFYDVTIPAGSYIFSYTDSESSPSGSTYQASISVNGQNRWGLTDYPFTVSEPATIRVVLRVYPAFDGTAVFKPMIRKATVADGTFEPYQEPKTYTISLDEPLNEGDFIDFRQQKNGSGDIVLMPAVITINGTNVLSVDTTVQPAKIYLQGGIEEMPVSLQMLSPLNFGDFQGTMGFNDGEFSPDIMPTDENSPDIMPIDTPNLQLNDVGGVESAE